MPIYLPDNYGFVLLVASSTFFINTYHVLLTVKARKLSGLKYPVAYGANDLAEKDPKVYAFNCTQRAHANFTETLTPFLGALLVSGLRFPIVAAGLGAGWALARVAYAMGYTGKGPEGRRLGAISSAVMDTCLKVLAVVSSVSFILEQK